MSENNENRQDAVNNTNMFHSQIDVAQIMREIKQRVAGEHAIMIEDHSSKDVGAYVDTLTEVSKELVRINEFVENTRRDAEMCALPGSTIQVNKSSAILRKAVTFYKRFVRKSTRYLFLDQLSYNEKINACIKALREAQDQNIKLLRVTNQFCKEQQLLLDEQKMSFQQQQVLLDEQKLALEAQKMLLKEQAEKVEKLWSKENSLPDDVYLRFENAFRGSEDEVKQRLRFYYDNYVAKRVNKDKAHQILDLGCGRGEWLDILRSEGYVARGIDFNADMVDLCLHKGLDVACEDLLAYLKQCPNESVQLITGFQVAEHLSLKQIQELMREANRVLTSEGMIILEVPNCRNVEVGTMNFYQDPTHIRPLHPELMQFLARENGLHKTDIVMWKEAEIKEWIDSVIASDTTTVLDSAVVRVMFESLKTMIYNCPDYALIATKEAEEVL